MTVVKIGVSTKRMAQYTPLTYGGANACCDPFDPHDRRRVGRLSRRSRPAARFEREARGRALSIATGAQGSPTIAPDGAGGAIVTWEDYRSTTYSDIYAQRVQANGQLGGDAVSVPGEASLTFALDPVRPNPTRGGTLTVRFTLATSAIVSLGLFDVVGRRIAAREVGSLGAGRHALDLGEGRRLAPGLYLVCLRQDANTRVTRVAVLR